MNPNNVIQTVQHQGPIIQKYRENPARPGTFDLVNKTDRLNLKYFVLTDPRKEQFKNQGAMIICEAWNNGIKTLFTGLRLLRNTQNVYYGNQTGPEKTKSLFCLVKEENTYQIHYFPKYCPKTNRSQIAFLRQYFMDLNNQIQNG